MTTMTITVESPAFADGRPIPKRHTGDGENVSPALAWSGLPDGTREVALVCDDPDVPMPKPWVHWVVYEIPADAGGLPEGIPAEAGPGMPADLSQGMNSWRTIGYRGPAPPPGHGVHHYRFRLYALDTTMSAGPGLEKDTLLELMKRHVLATGELVGTYER